MSDASHRAALVECSHAIHARGWVANHDGNVTHRLSDGRFLATPTATSKARVDAASLLVVDGAGAKVGTTGGRPFSELGLHLAVYAARSDVHAVLHAHPPHATAFAVAGRPLDATIIAEAVVSIGPSVPLVPFAMPGPGAASALAPFLVGYDAVLLGNHGVLTWGVDVEQAYLRMELVEHLARVTTLAQQIGSVRTIPPSALPPLAEARAKAGLGPRGRGVKDDDKPQVIACAPAPSDAPVTVRDDKRTASTDLAAIIRDEVARALRRG